MTCIEGIQGEINVDFLSCMLVFGEIWCFMVSNDSNAFPSIFCAP